MAKNMSPSVTRPVSISTLGVAQKQPENPSRKLPGSNYGPCQCEPTSGDRISGIPDNVLRPARKEVDVSEIGAQMKYKDKGYATVEPLTAPNE